MKIVLINKFYPPVVGGIEYHVRLLAQNLIKFREVEKVEIVVANNCNKWSHEQEDEKLYITRVPSQGIIASTPIAFGLIDYLKKIDADVVHFHFPYPFGDFAWLLSRMDKPIVLTYHADIGRQKWLNYLYKPIRNLFFKKVKTIIATSPRLIENSLVLQKYVDKTVCVPLGIDPKPFFEVSGIQLGKGLRKKFPEDKPIVLFVGRLVYYKGVEYLIEAFKEIDATLIMVGTGPLKKKLEGKIRKNKIEDKVYFFGDVTDENIIAFFQICDIFVLPSVANTEAYGLVQLEAMACGKPVISTNLPTGVPYVNQHEQTGLVVPPRDVNALSEALMKLVGDKVLRKKLGMQAKQRMLCEFTDEVMVNKIFQVYRDVSNKI